jgi:hypothetical protein
MSCAQRSQFVQQLFVADDFGFGEVLPGQQATPAVADRAF